MKKTSSDGSGREAASRDLIPSFGSNFPSADTLRAVSTLRFIKFKI